MKYKINVRNDSRNATILCKVRKLLPSGKDISEIKYHQVVSTFDDSTLLSKIGNRQFTLAEELKLVATVYEVVNLTGIDERQWIQNTLKNIYGLDSITEIETV